MNNPSIDKRPEGGTPSVAPNTTKPEIVKDDKAVSGATVTNPATPADKAK